MAWVVLGMGWLRAAAADESCEPIRPGPRDSWGVEWVRSATGAVEPAVRVYPRRFSEIWLEVHVLLADGSELGWTQGPAAPAEVAVYESAIPIPDEVGSELAQVSVLAVAVASDGRALSRHGVYGYAARADDGVRMWDASELRAVVEGREGVDGLVEERVTVAEVSP
jgi:hypothetical protein